MGIQPELGVSRRAAGVLAAALWLAFAAPGRAQDAGFRSLPGVEDQARALLRSLPEERGLTFGAPVVNPAEIFFPLHDAAEGDRVIGMLRLFDRRAAPAMLARRSRSFAFMVETFRRDEGGRLLSFLIAATRAVRENDDGTFEHASGVRGPEPPAGQIATGAMGGVPAGSLLVFFLPLAAWLFWLHGTLPAPGSRLPVSFAFKPVHALQTAVQGTIYVYWSLYWRGAWNHLPFLGLQLLFAYAFDACLSLTLRRRWDLGFGLFPVVGSINLFGWFNQPSVAFAVVALAVASKAFLQKNEKHVFNPSVIGVTIAGFFSFFTSRFAYDGTFHTLNIPPHMTEVVLLVSLIPLARFSVTLVSLGAWVGLSLMNPWFSVIGTVFPSTVITFTLLATDPATSPKRPAGRFVFGVFVGAAWTLTAAALVSRGLPDDFAKIFPVALANLLVPAFERLTSAKIFDQPLLERRWNPLHVALWLLLLAPTMLRQKPLSFEAALHWTYSTPRVAEGADGVPRCRDNPVFCTAFAFAREAGLWLNSPRS